MRRSAVLALFAALIVGWAVYQAAADFDWLDGAFIALLLFMLGAGARHAWRESGARRAAS